MSKNSKNSEAEGNEEMDRPWTSELTTLYRLSEVEFPPLVPRTEAQVISSTSSSKPVPSVWDRRPAFPDVNISTGSTVSAVPVSENKPEDANDFTSGNVQSLDSVPQQVLQDVKISTRATVSLVPVSENEPQDIRSTTVSPVSVSETDRQGSRSATVSPLPGRSISKTLEVSSKDIFPVRLADRPSSQTHRLPFSPTVRLPVNETRTPQQGSLQPAGYFSFPLLPTTTQSNRTHRSAHNPSRRVRLPLHENSTPLKDILQQSGSRGLQDNSGGIKMDSTRRGRRDQSSSRERGAGRFQQKPKGDAESSRQQRGHPKAASLGNLPSQSYSNYMMNTSPMPQSRLFGQGPGMSSSINNASMNTNPWYNNNTPFNLSQSSNPIRPFNNNALFNPPQPFNHNALFNSTATQRFNLNPPFNPNPLYNPQSVEAFRQRHIYHGTMGPQPNPQTLLSLPQPLMGPQNESSRPSDMTNRPFKTKPAVEQVYGRRPGIHSEWMETTVTPANKTNNSIKKGLSVDSPSFTPATLTVPNKSTAISSHAANATPFTPSGLASRASTPAAQQEAQPATFNPAQIREFTPQSYDISQSVTTNGAGSDSQIPFDTFSMAAVTQTLPTPYNPYLEDTSGITNGAGYYQPQTNYTTSIQPLQYHLYAPIGPHRENLLSYQRLGHDFFMPEKLREELQRKSEASLQVMPNSQLPTLDHYHTLVALDTSHHKSATVFGYPSWVYKATSSKDGKLYCLRRIEGFRLTNEKAIKSVKDWRRVDCGSVVTVHDAFTTRAFGDSSLIFVTDYHPLSKTLVEHHFTPNRYGNRVTATVPEQVLWGYIVQIASALKVVHAANLAVRCMEPSKVLLTNKNRIRLNACAVLDLVQFDMQRPLADLQQEDFFNFGKLILSVATNTPTIHPSSMKAAVDQLARSYTAELRDIVMWLLSPAQPPATKSISELLSGISSHIMDNYDSACHAEDTLTSELARELENGRIARLMMKLGTINERPEFERDPNWSEIGERYMLKLFRDYVFHQVDASGNPVINMGHILSCLNRLDAGTEDKIVLTSRDEQTCFIVTYKELRKQVAGAFGDLMKTSKQGRAF